MPICTLQDLYNDMQRTTEQVVKDKLEEQQVGSALPTPVHMPHAGTIALLELVPNGLWDCNLTL